MPRITCAHTRQDCAPPDICIVFVDSALFLLIMNEAHSIAFRRPDVDSQSRAKNQSALILSSASSAVRFFDCSSAPSAVKGIKRFPAVSP